MHLDRANFARLIPRRLPRLNKRYRALLAVLIILFVMYPNPAQLFVSIERSFNPPLDVPAVAELAQGLPDDPGLVEQAVLESIVPYAYDWDTSGMPWYFPTVSEVLSTARGDCQSRAVVLASILTAKGIPNRIVMSPVHVWVDYPGKVERGIEKNSAAFASQTDGGFELRLPDSFDLWGYTQVLGESLWDPMPLLRKSLLIAGLGLVLFGGVLAKLVAAVWRRREHIGRLPKVLQSKLHLAREEH